MISPALFPAILRAWWQYRLYEPVDVTPTSIVRWLRQYEPKYHKSLLLLLNNVIFLDKQAVLQALIDGHRKIEHALAEDGISPTHIVYMQVGDAGSSSPVMLNMLRDAERLERRNIPVLDSRDAIRISSLTSELDKGAIVYVDDFSGSGRQFMKARKFAAQYIAGSFSEFFLTAVMCDEAVERVSAAAIVPVPGLQHPRTARPLDERCTILPPSCREDLLSLGRRINEDFPLGYRNLGTNVVLYRNSPNSTPLLLRGSFGQAPYKGVLPAVNDLPVAG